MSGKLIKSSRRGIPTQQTFEHHDCARLRKESGRHLSNSFYASVTFLKHPLLSSLPCPHRSFSSFLTSRTLSHLFFSYVRFLLNTMFLQKGEQLKGSTETKTTKKPGQYYAIKRDKEWEVRGEVSLEELNYGKDVLIFFLPRRTLHSLQKKVKGV